MSDPQQAFKDRFHGGFTGASQHIDYLVGQPDGFGDSEAELRADNPSHGCNLGDGCHKIVPHFEA